jgi:hypothetical protein
MAEKYSNKQVEAMMAYLAHTTGHTSKRELYNQLG